MQWLHKDFDVVGLSQFGVFDESRVIFTDDTAPEVFIPPESTEMTSRYDSISADSAPSRVIEDSRTRLTLITTEAERGAAFAERDVAILARDAAPADRDAIVLQIKAIIDAHSETVGRATALLDHIDMMGQRVVGDAEASDLSITLSILLQLVSDL